MAITEEAGTPNRKGRPGYHTTTFTGDDVRKARGLLDKQAKESAAKIAEKKMSWTKRVRNHRGETRYVSEKSERQIIDLQRAYKKLYPTGPVSTRPTVSMGAYIKNGKVVRE